VDGLNEIPGFRCARPAGAFYVFPNVTGTGVSSDALADQLLTMLEVRPTAMFKRFVPANVIGAHRSENARARGDRAAGVLVRAQFGVRACLRPSNGCAHQQSDANNCRDA
jgi:hypothetical protein